MSSVHFGRKPNRKRFCGSLNRTSQNHYGSEPNRTKPNRDRSKSRLNLKAKCARLSTGRWRTYRRFSTSKTWYAWRAPTGSACSRTCRCSTGVSSCSRRRRAAQLPSRWTAAEAVMRRPSDDRHSIAVSLALSRLAAEAAEVTSLRHRHKCYATTIRLLRIQTQLQWRIPGNSPGAREPARTRRLNLKLFSTLFWKETSTYNVKFSILTWSLLMNHFWRVS